MCFDGAPEPWGFMSGTLVVCFEGGLAAGFIKGTLVVCFDGGALPTCLRSGTLVVCLEGVSGLFFKSGTLVVCFDGGAVSGFGGVEGWFFGSLMRFGVFA